MEIEECKPCLDHNFFCEDDGISITVHQDYIDYVSEMVLKEMSYVEKNPP